MGDADPGGSPPDVEVGRRSAHLGDLAATAACRRFVWPGWIVRGEFNRLSADVKVGRQDAIINGKYSLTTHSPDDGDRGQESADAQYHQQF